MIQNIDPYQFQIEYADIKPKDEDFVLMFSEHQLLIRTEPSEKDFQETAMMKAETIEFPQCDQLEAKDRERMNYLFAIDRMRFFYLEMEKSRIHKYVQSGWRLATRQEFRKLKPKHLAFAAVTAFQLDGWYTTNRFCGVCAEHMVHDRKERMLRCPKCGNLVYPRINPAVIVAVTDKERLLLTKYKGRTYKDYALVAGFVEVGESFEDTVRREVMEEAGLKVTNIRYYGSQPWAFADNILAGYICDVEGNSEITMDDEELSMACFMRRDEIEVKPTDSSLTNEMICAFKEGEI